MEPIVVLIKRHENYVIEAQRLTEKVNGRPVPQEKKVRCSLRLRDLKERLIPQLLAEIAKGDSSSSLWDLE